ncbi:hypothetical protein [Streptomyces sp. NPDC090022]|uniref:hypothetical protein n=1 Tax=Streptomyces sp. NPDC090022 TaxID=3365920 RepID=UPI003814AA55
MTVTAPPAAPGAERLVARPAPRRGRGRSTRTFAVTLAEAGTAVFAALLLTWLSMSLRENPMERIGQVSGLAAIQLRLLALLTVTVLLYAALARRMPGVAVRLGAAAVAGLATGVTAAGSVVALRGTVWPMYANWGDAGTLQSWAYDVMDGVALPPSYPPGLPYLLAWTAELAFGGDVAKAMKWLMIGFLALCGPAAYLAWRMLLPPLWALGIGVTASLPLVEPYKPYSPLVLMIVIPVFAKLVDTTQRSARLGRRRAMVTGGVLGAVLAALFLLYAGWFVWSAVGVVVLFAVVLVGLARSGGARALLDGLLVLASSLGVFLVLAGGYMTRLLGVSGSTKDNYFYFDTLSDPAYFAMWGASMPGPLRSIGWPPPGELGGVGLFTIVLVAGLGVAVALGLRQPTVLTLAACTASAFALRYWYASHMARDQAVQLYPRTSLQIVYCLIALTGLAVYLGAGRIRDWLRTHEALVPGLGRRGVTGPRRRAGVIGALCALGLLFGTAGSATADAYMPRSPAENSTGQLAWTSHNVRQPDGTCPRFAVKGAIQGDCAVYIPPVRGGKGTPPGQQRP